VSALFRRAYGAGPAHLLAMLGCLTLAGYAATRVIADDASLLMVGIWFVGAAVAHDALLYPLYAVADVAVQRRLLHRDRPAPAVPWINHVRVPVALSALLLLMWFPLIFGGRADAFLGATGHTTDVYLSRWAWITGTLLAGSALLYALRLVRHTGVR
jgi:hypothetical protein